MVQNEKTIRNQPTSLIVEMSRTVGYHTGRDPKHGTPIDNSLCAVLRKIIRKKTKNKQYL